MAGAGEVQLRFRHHTGDLGPLVFQVSATIADVKDRLLKEWPQDGPMSKEITPDFKVECLKLILSGKFVETGKTLADYKKEMGDNAIVTMHMVIRPASSVVKAAGAVNPDKQEQKGCSCVIC